MKLQEKKGDFFGACKTTSSSSDQSIVRPKIKYMSCHSKNGAGAIIMEKEGDFGSTFLSTDVCRSRGCMP